MGQLCTDKILLEIFKEQKTLDKFIETIFGFLVRNTNFGLIDTSERARIQRHICDALTFWCPVQQTGTKNVTTECEPPTTTEAGIGAESGNVGSELQWTYLAQARNATSEGHLVLNSDHGIFNAVQKNEPNIKYRAILPKEQHLVLSNMPTIFHKTNDEKLKNNSKRLYKCSECSDIFISFRQLKVHEALHTSVTDRVISICVYCCSLYANAETLEKHISESHANGRYLCAPCAKTYKSRGQLLRHVHSSAHNAKALLFYCSLCPRTGNSHIEFPSRAALQQHYQEMHLLMPASQDEDDVEIEMNEEFLDEFLLNNVNENSFNFSECWDALDLNLPDMLHLANSDENYSHNKNSIIQNNEFPFKCPICYDGFLTQKLLLLHIASKHGLKVLICNKCDSSFKDYTQWVHHKRTHRVQFDAMRKAKDDLMKCEICDKIFRSNAALNYHVKTHLRNYLQVPQECPYCKRNFYSDVNFKQHIRIVHSLNKRHKCELCDKPFATQDHLKKHVLSQHQNERKHICHVCSKSFTQLCHLKQHLAIHTTGKAHQCIKCKLKFWRKIDLQRHMLKKHS
ncbi:zinc finger protein 271-like isoform X1 [Anastrepha ludens]|uniref:zinc finger protein 271-like isoform X1 n=1 Tax=Anastrepha ludens TaxID=28586 RepID=UPI0023AF90DC|nr:zinc finger protein 271-like isoform X1 [Anastrepha ludens]